MGDALKASIAWTRGGSAGSFLWRNAGIWKHNGGASP
jgi:hypothetical protein